MLNGLFCNSSPSEAVADAVDGRAASFQGRLDGIKIMRKPHDPRGNCGFVGLENQGATCYLNSLIQVMYMTPEFRSGLFSVDPLDLGFDLVEEDQKHQNMSANLGVIEPDEQIVDMLLGMGFDEKKVRCAVVRAKNDMEKAFEIIDTISEKEVQKFNVQHNAVGNRKRPRYIPLELQRLFTELQCIDQSSVSTQELTTKGFQWQSAEGRVQHDAHELNRLLLEAVEKSLKNTPAQYLCQELYTGSLINQVLCLECLNLSERHETFSDLNLQVANCSDFVSAIHQYCGKEVLTGPSAYQCDKCSRRTTASRATVIEKLPEYLTISCNRFKIDKSTNWQRVKVTTKSDYPLMMDLTTIKHSYNLKNLLNDPSLLPSSLEQINEWAQSASEDLSTMRQNMLWMADVKEKSLEFIQQKFISFIASRYHDFQGVHCMNREMLLLLKNEFQLCEIMVSEYRKMIGFQEMLSSSDGLLSEHIYILHSIIVHQGNAYSGHYYAYIRDNQCEGNVESFNCSIFMDQLKRDVQRESDGSTNHKCSQKKGTTSKHQEDQLYYLHDPVRQGSGRNANANIECWIADSSVLGKILSVYSHIEKKNAQRSSGKKKNEINRSTTFGQSFSVSVEQLCREFPDFIGGSWDKLHRKEHGRLDEFIKCHDQIFVAVKEDSHSSNKTNPNGNSKSGSIRYVVNPALDIKLVSTEELVQQIANGESLRHENAPRMLEKNVISANNAWTNTNHSPLKSNRTIADVNRVSKVEGKDLQSNDESQEFAIEFKLLINQFAESLMRIVFGNYFEFNDHKINPLSFSSINNCFEGVNSAYLLVYKRFHHEKTPSKLVSDSHTSKDSQLLAGGKKVSKNAVNHQSSQIHLGKSVSNSKAIASQSQPPALWLKIIEERNKALTTEREIYRELTSRVKIGIVLEGMFDYELPLLKLKKSSNDVSLEKVMVPFECASTLTIGKLMSEVSNLIQLRDALVIDGQNLQNNWQISILDEFGVSQSIGYYPRNVIDPNCTVGDSLVSGNVVFIWKRHLKTIGDNTSSPEGVRSFFDKNVEYCNASVCYGDSCRPIPTKVRKYAPSKVYSRTSVKKRLNLCLNPVEESQHTVYIPSNYLLMDALMILSQQMSINFFQSLQVSIRIPIFQDASSVLRESETHNAEVSKEDSLNATRIYALFDSGKLLLHAIPNGPNIDVTTTKLKDMWYLQELLVEASEDRGLQGTSLMERHSNFINNAMSVKIILEDSVLQMLQNVENVENGGVSEFIVQVSKNAVVADFKEELLVFLGDSALSLLPHIVLRTGSKSGEGVLEEEKLTSNVKLNKKKAHVNSLIQLGVQPNQSIFMEYCAPDTLQAIVNISVKYRGRNSLGASVIQVQCGPTTTVKELREKIGSMMFNLPPLWTHHDQSLDELMTFCLSAIQAQNEDSEESQSIRELKTSQITQLLEDYEGWRLRSSTWMGEPGDLLEEVGASGEFNTIESLNIASWDLIFFEPGRVLLPNMIVLKVYAWKTAESRIEKDATNVADKELITSEPVRPLRIEDIYANRLFRLCSLGELTLLHSADMKSLYEQVAELAEKGGMDTFVVRELRVDYLPGRTLLPDSSSNRPNLKKLGLKTGSSIVLQKVDAVPANTTDRSFKLWIQRLKNPQQASNGNAILIPDWPPHEITIHGGSCPMMGHLVRPILELLPDIARSDLCILRYNPITAQWCLLETGTEVGKKSNKSYKADSNICNAPFNLRDGDVLAVFSLKEVNTALVQALREAKPGTLTQSFNQHDWDVSTKEDILLRKLREVSSPVKKTAVSTSNSEKKTPFSTGKTSTKGNVRHSVEKALVIKMDNFDD